MEPTRRTMRGIHGVRILSLGVRISCTLLLVFVFTFWSKRALNKYFSDPISTTLSYRYGDDSNGNVLFPRVTVCPNGFLVFNQAKEPHTFRRKCNQSVLRFMWLFDVCLWNTTELKAMESPTTEANYKPFGGLFDLDEPAYRAYSNATELLTDVTIPVDYIIRRFHLSGTFLSTTTHPLSEGQLLQRILTSWDQFYHRDFGHCQTFNHQNYPELQTVPIVDESTYGTMSDAGNLLSLRFMINFRYFLNFTQDAKMLVMLHSQEDVYDAIDLYPWFEVSRGRAYSFGVKKTVINSLQTGNLKCTEDDSYGPHTCQYLKSGVYTVKKYGCRLAWMKESHFHAPLCQDRDLVKAATLELRVLHRVFKVQCPRLPRCRSTLYSLQESSNSRASMGTDDHAEVTIRFESSLVEHIQDQLAYDLQSLIGEVGGTLGLMLGLSVLSFVNFLEAIAVKLTHLWIA